jgi:hypothetical protein
VLAYFELFGKVSMEMEFEIASKPDRFTDLGDEKLFH